MMKWLGVPPSLQAASLLHSSTRNPTTLTPSLPAHAPTPPSGFTRDLLCDPTPDSPRVAASSPVLSGNTVYSNKLLHLRLDSETRYRFYLCSLLTCRQRLRGRASPSGTYMDWFKPQEDSRRQALFLAQTGTEPGENTVPHLPNGRQLVSGEMGFNRRELALESDQVPAGLRRAQGCAARVTESRSRSPPVKMRIERHLRTQGL
ncbi:uncharacterized protein LOC124528887 [Lynx rufus]|uniref:uncharacterized protein LOC124528887 n=1 Tax=Lynx rufus TaxID=61384 RepID=UPI001F12387A|nr:uncharacterized protein LOC124528887 [Lynx rufus]